MESLGMTVLRHLETSNESTPQRLLKELTSFLKPFGREPPPASFRASGG